MKIKSLVLQAIALCLLPMGANAQKKATIDWYGFVAAQSFIDTHTSTAGAEGFLYLYPTDRIQDPVDQHDQAAIPQASWFGTMARLGFTLKGPEIFGAASRAKAEIEFSGHSAPGSVLYRHAFIALDWDKSTLTLGQTWHPMNDLFPSTVGIAIGSPFNALNRSPQLRYEYFMGDDKYGVLDGEWLFINKPSEEQKGLYRYVEKEKKNYISEYPEVAAEMQKYAESAWQVNEYQLDKKKTKFLSHE